MSVVIAIKTDKGFMLGADKQATWGQYKLKTNDKIFKLDDCPNTVIGGVGMLQEIQGVQYIEHLIPEINILKDEVDTKIIYTKVFTNIITFLKDNKRISGDTLESMFIIAYKDKGWLINHDGAINEINDYEAIGSGEAIALGSLSETKNLEPEQRIKLAIQATADKTIYVDDDIHILTTY